MTNISILSFSEEEDKKVLDGIELALNYLHQALDEDIARDSYGSLGEYVQGGSNLEFFLKQVIANEQVKATSYNVIAVETEAVVFSSENEGYVDHKIKIEDTKDGNKVGERIVNYRFHFLVGEDKVILFTRNEKVN